MTVSPEQSQATGQPQAAGHAPEHLQRVAMVTGGSRGIGLGITRGLLDAGFAVSMLATREEPTDLIAELSQHGPVHYTQGSVDDLVAHERFLTDTTNAFGRVDVLVNNAGVAPTERLDVLETTPESWDRVLNINLRGPFFLTQLVARQMIGQPVAADAAVRGSIINVSSISATTVSVNRGEYVISKAGVAMATKIWAARLAEYGIVVHEVRPGVIATDMTVEVKEVYDAKFADGLAPMSRWGTPEDVAGAVIALTARTMPYSTGDVIHVDGGMHIRRL